MPVSRCPARVAVVRTAASHTLTQLKRCVADAAAMPRLMLAGLLVVAVGGAADVAYHALPAATALGLAPYLGHEGGAAHVVTFAGMVLTMVGMFSRRFASAASRPMPVTVPDDDQLRRRSDNAVR